MLIVLVRHADREHRPDRAEAAQVLTPKGRETAAQLAENLAARLKQERRAISRCLSSAYARAVQTAELVAPRLGIAAEQVEKMEVLQTEPDGSVEQSFEAVLKAASNGVMVVGHGPDLAELCQMLCGVPYELKKANALAIEWDAEKERGRFLWHAGHK